MNHFIEEATKYMHSGDLYKLGRKLNVLYSNKYMDSIPYECREFIVEICSPH